jgi:DNA-binding NtrC family response regulator
MQETHGIWIVSDTETARTVLRVMASRLPLDLGVSCFSSLSETLDALNTHHPELIICDLRRPPSAMLELIFEVRSRRSVATLPLIACLDGNDPRRREAAASGGVTDFVSIPVQYWELQHRASLLVDFHRKQRTLTRLKQWHLRMEPGPPQPGDDTDTQFPLRP